jgi:hypothetical protein
MSIFFFMKLELVASTRHASTSLIKVYPWYVCFCGKNVIFFYFFIYLDRFDILI